MVEASLDGPVLPDLPPRHEFRVLNAAGAAFAAALRLMPRSWRFPVAFHAAFLLEPLLRRTRAWSKQPSRKVDGAAEMAVHLVLNALTTHGTRFDPIIDVEGLDELVEAFGAGRGLLLVAPHAANGLLLLHLLAGRGIQPLVITADRMLIPGKCTAVEPLPPSPTFLLTARSRLREGRLLCAMLDRARHHTRQRTMEFETERGPVIFAPALLGIAARCGAEVAFCEVHVENRRLAGTIRLARARSGSGIEEEFIAFVRARMAARDSVEPSPAELAGANAEAR